MKVFAECMSCFIDQLSRAIRLLVPNTPEDIIVKAQQKLMRVIADQNLSEIKNHHLSLEVYRIAGEVLGVDDPFKAQKEEFNKIALDLTPKIEDMIKKSDQPLLTATRVCILGNSIDFGAPLEINIKKELEGIENNDLGGSSNIDQFLNSVRDAKKILILGDNAGEIVFDRIFIEKLKKSYPNKDFIYSVRSGPIINDATMIDAISVGINKICTVVESSPTAGISLEECSSEFIRAFNTSDLILSKGQGNFESLVDIPTGGTETYFMLKAKCVLMEKIFRVPLGTLLLVKKEPEFIRRITSEDFRKNK